MSDRMQIRVLLRVGVACGWLLAPWPAVADALSGAREALAAGDPAAALLQARTATAERPQSAQAWQLLGAALAATGEYRAAMDAYRQALSQDSTAGVEVALARLQRLLGDAAGADARLRAVIERSPDDGGFTTAELLARGHAYRDLARDDPALFVRALDAYEAALRLGPAEPAIQVAIGDLLLGRYNNTEALEAYREALRLDDRHLPALYGLARSQRFDHSPDAEETLRALAQTYPAYLPARVLLARLLIDSEHHAEAEAEIEAVLAINPRSPAGLTALAALRYLADDAEAFAELTAEVRRTTPGYSEMYQTLAEIAGQNRRYSDAASFAAMAVRLDPSAWRGHALLGQNRLRLGAMEAGRDSMEVAFRGDPFDARTKNTLDLLDRLSDFNIERSERFILVAAPGESSVLAPRLLPLAEQAYEFFAARYDFRPPTPIRIEIYPRHEDFSVRTVGLVGVDILGVSFGPVVALDSPSAGAFGPFNWASAMWHEIAHSFHLALTRSRVPRWFTEGLAVYEERQARPGWGADVSPGFLRAFEQGRLAPVADLSQAFLRPSYAQQIAHAYYQSSLLMEIIEERHGFEAINRLLRGYAAGGTTAQLLDQVLGMDAAALEAEFQRFVRARFERSLAGISAAAGSAQAAYPRLLRDAGEAFEAGELERAVGLAEQALRLFPAHGGRHSAYAVLARIREAQGDVPGAIELLEQSVAIDADDPQGLHELLRLYEARAQPARAIATLQRTLLIEPFVPAHHVRLAELQESAEAWAAAVQSRSAVVALAPSDPAGSRYRLALALSRAEQPQRARRELLRTLEQAPMYAEALELLLLVREQIRPGADATAASTANQPDPDGVPGAEPEANE